MEEYDKSKEWYGFDLDGTTFSYSGWVSHTHIGEPVQLMIDKIKSYLEEGKTVKIFTARVAHDGTEKAIKEAKEAEAAIKAVCLKYLGQELEVTCVKDKYCVEIWDDRAKQVIPNTGINAVIHETSLEDRQLNIYNW